MSDTVPRLTVTSADDGVVVAGDLDAHTCTELSASLDPLPGSGDIRLDVGGVTFMDSSGLRAVIGAHQAAEAAGRRLLVVGPSKAVTRIFEISGLDDHLHIVAD